MKNLMFELMTMFPEGQLLPVPWEPMKIPEFEEAKFGKWEIADQSLPLARGYFSGLQMFDRKNFALKKGHDVWMSLSPREIESMEPHVSPAKGLVVVAGIGMGVYLYNVMMQEAVEEIVAIDVDADIVDMVRSLSRSWKGAEKVSWLVADANTYVREAGQRKVDWLFADIWLNLGGEKILGDAQEMATNLKPTQMGFWGQELEFVAWLAKKNGKKRNKAYRRDWKEWLTEIKLPLVTHPNYWNLSLEAARRCFLS